MSYPDPRYLGTTGEVTAAYRPVSTPPELPRRGGSASYLATGATTDGRFGLYRWDMDAHPAGADPHFHRTFTESFFVLSGRPQLNDGARWFGGTPGDFVHVPEGGLHGFRNHSGEPASLLILFTPGVPREGYFEGLVEMAEGRWEPSEEEFAEFCERHDNIYV